MTSASQKGTSIIRTERGLAISGTRITLYDIARLAAQSPKTGTEAAWEKLRAIKAKREAKYGGCLVISITEDVVLRG